ncbi:DUF5068 domain-containing protein [Lederbergia lenta]|uniref:Putative lipoprotein n=1 Tax=Lederbergia lenta TaxID=1467 RepID=A0A2X4YU75_LEDLE|nr:DUF5068 domain-containing protein [Lederbergia lenta]MCM3111184.1 DUF5068 domain-containing protein [Lederbergia lenta]MEC2325428.1 DUF5068 domain-containing protein [Lederbergia lenta]SQI55285.1 putative lipoprotein [Lederbergia lenta]
MTKRLIMLFTTMLLAALVISACGSKEVKKEESEDKTDNKVAEKVKAEEEKDKDKDKETEEDVDDESEKEGNTADNTTSKDFAEMITYMEEETEGTTKVLYENNEPQVHNADGVSISLDSYVLVELNDFHTDFNIPFNDQTDGGVILAHYTVKNELDKDAYFMPALYLSFTGAPKAYNNYRDLLPREDQLPEKISPPNDYLIKAGETITGYYAYPFSKDDLATILELSTVVVEVPKPHAEKGDVNSNFGKEGKFTLSLNADGAAKIADNEAFYQDRATREDMGDKKMVKEKDGINKSETLGDVTVTLDGYQFTEFTPNAEEAPRFSSFTNGITLLTIKLKLDNKGTDDIGLSSMSSKLTVNDGAQYLLNEGMLLNYRNDDIVKTGESGELLQIFVLDQEQYEKIWKDKAFEFEIGPIRNTEAKDISKGKKATFNLPN